MVRQDQRSEDRVSYSLRFTVAVHSGRDESLVGKFVDCEAVDFSKHGMQLSSAQGLGTGTQLVITLGVGKPTVTYRLLGEVRWSRKSDGKYYMGIQLVEEDGFDLAPWIVNFNRALTS